MIRTNYKEYMIRQSLDSLSEYRRYENKDIYELYIDKDEEVIEDINKYLTILCKDNDIAEDLSNKLGYIVELDKNNYMFYSDKFIEKLLLKSFKEFKVNEYEFIKEFKKKHKLDNEVI